MTFGDLASVTQWPPGAPAVHTGTTAPDPSDLPPGQSRLYADETARELRIQRRLMNGKYIDKLLLGWGEGDEQEV